MECASAKSSRVFFNRPPLICKGECIATSVMQVVLRCRIVVCRNSRLAVSAPVTTRTTEPSWLWTRHTISSTLWWSHHSLSIKAKFEIYGRGSRVQRMLLWLGWRRHPWVAKRVGMTAATRHQHYWQSSKGTPRQSCPTKDSFRFSMHPRNVCFQRCATKELTVIFQCGVRRTMVFQYRNNAQYVVLLAALHLCDGSLGGVYRLGPLYKGLFLIWFQLWNGPVNVVRLPTLYLRRVVSKTDSEVWVRGCWPLLKGTLRSWFSLYIISLTLSTTHIEKVFNLLQC